MGEVEQLEDAVDKGVPESDQGVDRAEEDSGSLEDALAAGALCDLLWTEFAAGTVADSALLARELYRLKRDDLLGAVQQARNGRRLSAIPELRDDLPVCLQRDTLAMVAALTREGTVRRLS